jgi:hypothetical protein
MTQEFRVLRVKLNGSERRVRGTEFCNRGLGFRAHRVGWCSTREGRGRKKVGYPARGTARDAR